MILFGFLVWIFFEPNGKIRLQLSFKSFTGIFVPLKILATENWEEWICFPYNLKDEILVQTSKFNNVILFLYLFVSKITVFLRFNFLLAAWCVQEICLSKRLSLKYVLGLSQGLLRVMVRWSIWMNAGLIKVNAWAKYKLKMLHGCSSYLQTHISEDIFSKA